MIKFRILLIAAAVLAQPCVGATGFLRDGDVWVFHGDSITHADTYRRICERVFRHYHPDTDVTFVQAGVWGRSSSDLVKRLKSDGHAPTVVSLMLGMNNAINGAWVRGRDLTPYLDAYRRDITAFVREHREGGAAVVLMSPTLVDETTRNTVFRLDGANAFLLECGRIVREVALAEGAFYLPVQEEFEAFQAALDTQQKLRPDGVHPAALGQYQIARTLWRHLGFAHPVADGPRVLTEPPPDWPVTLAADARFVPPGAGGLVFTVTWGMESLEAPTTAHWSLGNASGRDTLDAGEPWNWAPPSGLPALEPGETTELVVELQAGSRRRLFLVDLCAVPVLRFTDNVIAGMIRADDADSAGREVATWHLERLGGELVLDVRVADTSLDASSPWAWARDGLNLFWDLRPADRFAAINLDTDVHQTLVNVYDTPFVAAAVRPGLGTGMPLAATAAAEQTDGGYRVRFRLHADFGLHRPLALAKRDVVGFSLGVTDATPGERTRFHDAFPAQRPRDQYANSFPILDLTDRLPDDSVINVHVFPPR